MIKKSISYQHGDYHLGNMIVNNGHIGIIDFDKFATSDPMDDFKCIIPAWYRPTV